MRLPRGDPMVSGEILVYENSGAAVAALAAVVACTASKNQRRLIATKQPPQQRWRRWWFFGGCRFRGGRARQVNFGLRRRLRLERPVGTGWIVAAAPPPGGVSPP